MAQPKNLEVVSQGSSTVFNITLLNRLEAIGGTPVNPDGYTPPGTPTSGQLSVAVKIYNTATSTYDDPATSVPGVVIPTVGAISYGGSTGAFEVTVSASATATLSTALPAGKYWAIQWTALINTITVTAPLREIFTVVPTGSGLFGDLEYCSAADVSGFLQSTTFTSSTRPTLTQVNDVIQAAMDEIDWYTQHAWREVQSPLEYYDYNGSGFYFGSSYGSYPWSYDAISGHDTSDRGRIYLRHRGIRDLITFEVWDGSSWVNWLSTKTEGRGQDYFLQEEDGAIWFGKSYPWGRGKSVRVRYTYGEDTVPGDIKQACIYLVCSRLAMGDDRSVLLPEGTSNIPLQTKAQSWHEAAYRLLQRRKEMVSHPG